MKSRTTAYGGDLKSCMPVGFALLFLLLIVAFDVYDSCSDRGEAEGLVTYFVD